MCERIIHRTLPRSFLAEQVELLINSFNHCVRFESGNKYLCDILKDNEVQSESPKNTKAPVNKQGLSRSGR